MKNHIFRNREKGTTMAEFAIISVIFFMIIFGIIEFGRLMYTHNALTDAARRAARFAVVHDQIEIDCAKAVAVYGETQVNMGTCAGTGPALINGLTTDKVVITYEGADEDNNPNTPSTPFGMNLGTATASIQNYDFILSIPFARQTIRMPAYTTTLSAESAGQTPVDIGP